MWMRRRIRQVDVKTGEVLDGVVAYLVPKRQNGFQRWFAMGQEDALEELMDFKRLDDFRVLVALIKRLDYENLIIANQADIARRLSMSSAQVNRAIRRLVEVGVILRGAKAGINCSYQLNPEFGWKGSTKNHVTAIDEHRRKRMKPVKIASIVKSPAPDETQEAEQESKE